MEVKGAPQRSIDVLILDVLPFRPFKFCPEVTDQFHQRLGLSDCVAARNSKHEMKMVAKFHLRLGDLAASVTVGSSGEPTDRWSGAALRVMTDRGVRRKRSRSARSTRTIIIARQGVGHDSV